jgi:outer membrane protein assembly factor BamD (BamD/ComL family)
LSPTNALQANLRGTDEDKAAIQLWSELIASYPASSYRMDAIQAIIETQNRYLGQIQLAIAPPSAWQPNFTLTRKPLIA